MIAKGRGNSLSRSFMFMSFFTAVLLIGVQVGNVASNEAEADTTISLSAESIELIDEPDSQPTSQPIAQNYQDIATDAVVIADAAQSLGAALGQLASSSTIPTLQDTLEAPVAQQTELIVDLSDRQVQFYRGQMLQSSYEIAIGQEGWETPTGSFNIINMQQDPVWKHPLTGEVIQPGPDNPLGTHWIGFWTDGSHQIGFHGTNQEELIGQAVSHGCIRMRNADIQTIYSQVEMGTPVIVQP